MSVNMTTWQPEIYTSIVGVPTPGLIHAVRNTARQFCLETQLWTLELTRISVVANQNNYTITIPAAQYAELIVIDNVKYKQNGLDDDQFKDLDPISEETMDKDERENDAWKYETAPTPTKFWMEPDDDTTLYLYRKPTLASTSGLLVRVILMPSKTATVVPDFVYYKHEPTITKGTLAELYAMKTMPWYDPNLAGAWAAAFKAGIADAKMMKQTGLTNRPLSVRMRSFV